MKKKLPLPDSRQVRLGSDPLPLAMMIGFLQSFAIGYVTLGIVYYAADRFKVSPALIGLLAAAYTLAYGLSCFVLSRVISRFKPYQAILLGVTMQLILSQVAIRVSSLSLLTLVYLVFGISTGFVWPPLMGWMSRGRDGLRLNRAMSAYNFSWSIPWMLSPFVTGLLYEMSPLLPFHFCTLFSLLVILVMVVYLIIFKNVRESAHSEYSLKKKALKGEDRSTPLRFLAWINLFPAFLLIGIFGSIFPIFLRGSFSLPESQVGLVILIRALVTILVFFAMGRRGGWHFNRKGILLSTPVMALALGFFTGAHLLWHYIIWTILAGAIVGYTYMSSMFHGLSGAVERQKRMNIHEIVLTAAMLAGSLLGGILLDRFGMKAVIAFVSITMGISLIPQLVVDFYIKKAEKNEISHSREPF